ncbi:MAG TPA: protein kinase [Roseiflexaceae bacterium]|nr:protein kinase [Roseiflexaceae bacterium]
MADQDDIALQMVLLATHRQTLAEALHPLVGLDAMAMPAATLERIRTTRLAISACKATLRAKGVKVDDLPDDAPETTIPAPPGQRALPPGVQFAPGTVLKTYTLGRRVAEGGFGAVYRARQAVVDRDVAVKVIRPEFAGQPEFIRRFEAEAQIVARLEHPHIVPLYDYWRDPSGAYLVMRWMQGGSLASLLGRGPLPLDRLARLFDQVISALALAHRRGVIHRDIKPANILLDEDGNAYLADFGIAKDLAEQELIWPTDQPAFTPGYAAPEQILVEQVTPQADLYSLGIMLYELLTGERAFQGSTPEIIRQQLQGAPPTLRERRSDLPHELDRIIQRATATDRGSRYASIAELAADLRRVLARPGASAASTAGGQPGTADPNATLFLEDLAPETPYKGLRAFQEADAADFFGREALIRRLYERLSDGGVMGDGYRVSGEAEDTHDPSPITHHPSRFLAVVGPSGSGKSSAVRAGLVPALRAGAIPGSERWFVVPFIPGPQPLEELDAALARVAASPTAGLLADLRADTRGLARAVQRILPADPAVELLLVIDQFEELFTLVADERLRAHVIDSMLEALREPRSRLRVVVTLRADFYDRPLQYPELGQLMRQGTELVLPLTNDELERAIVAPAQRAGVAIEPALLSALLEDVSAQPGALPLLQYALTDLFERRSGRVLTQAAYRARGGLLGALARRADELYLALPPSHQELARQLFLRLVTPGENSEDTRRRVPLAELAGLTMSERQHTNNGAGPRDTATNSQLLPPIPLVDEIIDQYSRARLLTLDRDPISREPTVEVAHEALIRTWDRLRDWVEASRADLLVQRRLLAAVADWAAAGRDRSFLATGARLEQFQEWAATTTLALGADEQVFLESSLAEQAARQAEARQAVAARRSATTRMRWILALLALVLLASGGLAAVFVSRQAALRAEEAAQHARVAAEQNAHLLGLFASAGQSLFELDRAPDRALLLALAAVPTDTTTYPPMVARALYRVYDGVAARRIMRGPASPLRTVAWSPDGRLALTGGEDGTLRVWDIGSGAQLRELKGHIGSVWSVAWSPDGKQALSGAADGTLRVWDVGSGAQLRELKGHTGRVWSVAWSPDGTRLLSGGADATLRVWDASSGALLQTLTGHVGVVRAVAWSPDARRMLSGGEDASARIWTLSSDESIILQGHTGAVLAAAWRADGTQVLTGGSDNTARVWDVASGRQIRTFAGHTSFVYAAAWSPDGTWALTGSADGTVRVWDVASGSQARLLRGHSAFVYAAAWSPDGRRALSADADGMLRLWDLAATARMRSLDGAGSIVLSAAWSPDGKQALTGDGDGVVRIWDAGTRRQLHALAGHRGSALSVTWSPDGTQALSSGADGTIRLWDVMSGQQLYSFEGQRGIVYSVAWSPDGKRALSGGADGTIQLWDIAGRKQLSQFEGHVGGVLALAWSPDGKRALSGGADNVIRLWDMSSDLDQSGAATRLVRELKGHQSYVYALAWRPDSTQALSGGADNTARIWNIADGAEQRVLKGQAGWVQSVAWRPDGRQVLTAGKDGVVRLWDAATGDELRALENPMPAPFYSVAWSHDGGQALTGGGDRAGRIWLMSDDVIVAELTRRMCGLFDDVTIGATVAGWPGCQAQLAALRPGLEAYDALDLAQHQASGPASPTSSPAPGAPTSVIPTPMINDPLSGATPVPAPPAPPLATTAIVPPAPSAIVVPLLPSATPIEPITPAATSEPVRAITPLPTEGATPPEQLQPTQPPVVQPPTLSPSVILPPEPPRIPPPPTLEPSVVQPLAPPATPTPEPTVVLPPEPRASPPPLVIVPPGPPPPVI